MFARVVDIPIYAAKKNELIKTVRRDILPILKKQPGFLEVIPLFPDIENDRMLAITLWTDKPYAEKFEKEVSAKVEEIVKFFLTGPLTIGRYDVETTLCEHLVEAFSAV